MTCSSETVARGNLGKVKVDNVSVARVTQFELTEQVDETAWGDSDSAGATNRVAGRGEVVGSMQGKFDNDSPVINLFAAGDTVALVLFENTTRYWNLPCALIRSYNVVIDTDTKKPVEWKADWASDGPYYRPGAVGAPAQTYPT